MTCCLQWLSFYKLKELLPVCVIMTIQHFPSGDHVTPLPAVLQTQEVECFKFLLVDFRHISSKPNVSFPAVIRLGEYYLVLYISKLQEELVTVPLACIFN